MNLREKLTFLEGILGESHYSSSTKEAMFFCCFCEHHKRKLSINLETDRWQCWVCNKNGKKLFFVLKTAGNRRDVEEYTNNHRSKYVEKIINYQDLEFRLDLPKEYLPVVECKSSVMGTRAMNYLTEGRGLTERDVLFYKIGVLTSGDRRGSVVVPSFDARGLLNWYSVRGVGSDMKWNPYVPKGYKNQIIPNDLNIDWSSPVVLVEGPFDWIKSINNTIPLYGNFLNTRSILFRQIVQNEVPVFMALDSDATSQSRRIARNFMRHSVPVYTVDIHPFKDVGEMSKDEFKGRYEKAEPLVEEDILRQKIRAIC